MRLWANLRYSTAICLGVLRNTAKKTKVSVPGSRFESETTQIRQKCYGFSHCHFIMSYSNVSEAHTRRIRDIRRSRDTATTVSPKKH